MKAGVVFACIAVGLLISSLSAHAGALWHESFESYALGALDSDTPGGPNAGTNGAPANPWWGQFPPDLEVVGPENGIAPHGGNQMARGPSGLLSEANNIFFNLAFRVNNGSAYAGNILLDWWFYDTVGTNSGGDQFQDYASIAFYAGMPPNQDYPASMDPGAFPLQALALGGTDHQGGAFDVTKYQAEVLGATNGYDSGDPGWLNTATTRDVGWHHALILVSPADTNGVVSVGFYIDDLIHPTLTNSTPSGTGFNCLQVFGYNGNTTAYYDDFRFYTNPPPIATLQIARAGTNAVVSYLDSWTLQAATNLSSGSFMDVTNAASPYTNSLDGPVMFFRLRN